MDTLTHALSGALAARATEPGAPRAGHLPRRTRMWIGFWAAAFPDSDFVARFIDPLMYLTVHRGITHSIIMLPLWALGLAFLFKLFVRERYHWRAFAGVCALGIGTHIAGDVITAFGTMVFAPFSTWRAALPTTFIIDPYFTAIIVAGLVAAAIRPGTRRPAVAGLATLAVYVCFQGVLHERAVAVGEDYARTAGLADARTQAIPQPLSPFNWMVMVTAGDTYYMAYVNLVRREVPNAPAGASWLGRINASYRPAARAVWNRIPRFGDSLPEAVLARQVWNSETLAPYRRFALFPALYRVDRHRDSLCVWFNDLRFALAGARMPFRYGACTRGGGASFDVAPSHARRTAPGNAAARWQAYRLLSGENGDDVPAAINR